jgi:hypothetical protein
MNGDMEASDYIFRVAWIVVAQKQHRIRRFTNNRTTLKPPPLYFARACQISLILYWNNAWEIYLLSGYVPSGPGCEAIKGMKMGDSSDVAKSSASSELWNLQLCIIFVLSFESYFMQNSLMYLCIAQSCICMETVYRHLKRISTCIFQFSVCTFLE